MPAGCLCVSGTAQEQREKLVSTHLYRSLHNCHFLYLKEVAFNAFMVSFFFMVSRLPACQKPVYKNTDLAKRFLLLDAPFSLRGYIQHCNKTVWPLFSHLESAVRDGTNQHEKAFGKKSKDMFQVIIRLRWIKTGGKASEHVP